MGLNARVTAATTILVIISACARPSSAPGIALPIRVGCDTYIGDRFFPNTTAPQADVAHNVAHPLLPRAVFLDSQRIAEVELLAQNPAAPSVWTVRDAVTGKSLSINFLGLRFFLPALQGRFVTVLLQDDHFYTWQRLAYGYDSVWAATSDRIIDLNPSTFALRNHYAAVPLTSLCDRSAFRPADKRSKDVRAAALREVGITTPRQRELFQQMVIERPDLIRLWLMYEQEVGHATFRMHRRELMSKLRIVPTS